MKYNKKYFNKLINFVEKYLTWDHEDKYENSVFFFVYNEERTDVKIFIHIQRCKYSMSITIEKNNQTEFDKFCRSWKEINHAKALIKAIG